MKAWDFDAVVYDGAVYCVECVPRRAKAEETAPNLCLPRARRLPYLFEVRRAPRLYGAHKGRHRIRTTTRQIRRLNEGAPLLGPYLYRGVSGIYEGGERGTRAARRPPSRVRS